MADSDRICVVCDVVVDFLVSQRKAARPRKMVQVLLDRDEWGSIIVRVNSKSNKLTFKLEENIVKLYTANAHEGKSSIELKSPKVILYISNAMESSLRKVFGVLQQIKDHPETVNELELWNENEEDQGEMAEEDNRGQKRKYDT